MPSPSSPEPIDPWTAFDSCAEIAAFIHARMGADALRQCLEAVDDLDREFLQKAASELTAVGLPKVAKIVLKEAENRPSSIGKCPYPADSYDAAGWLRSWHRQHGR